MQPARLHRYKFAEYLELEDVARVRHEFLDGEIYAMAGGTPEHAAMAAAITAILGGQLAGNRVASTAPICAYAFWQRGLLHTRT